MSFRFEETSDGILIIRADGELERNSVSQFESRLQECVERGVSRIVVDCTNLTFITSVGLGMLVRAHGDATKRGGGVKMCAINKVVYKVLHLARLDRLLDIYPDVASAQAAFAKPGGGAAPISDST